MWCTVPINVVYWGHSLGGCAGRQVTADKERMAMEVEREEEFLTNKLVKKLDQLK